MVLMAGTENIKVADSRNLSVRFSYLIWEKILFFTFSHLAKKILSHFCTFFSIQIVGKKSCFLRFFSLNSTEGNDSTKLYNGAKNDAEFIGSPPFCRVCFDEI